MALGFAQGGSNGLTLFGGDKHPWQSTDWTASDDRVRGGKSQSYLECTVASARFYGTLDIKTLGGAGFASQRTTGDDREWDLSDYAGVQLNIAKGDKKRYTLILKDELLPPDHQTGREQATISYECDFELPPQTEPGESHNRSVFIPFKSLNPTYRGKLKKDAEPLDLKTIKRFSIMMRSFFGSQEGDFSLTISSIRALEKIPTESLTAPGAVTDMWRVEDAAEGGRDPASRFYHLRLNAGFVKADVQLHRSVALFLFGALSVAVCYQMTKVMLRAF